MKPEAQRIAIAKACGWHEICHYDYSGRFSVECNWPAHIIAKVKAEDDAKSGWRGYPPGTKERLERERTTMMDAPSNCAVYILGGRLETKALPDYPNDLDAMYEAEEVLMEGQRKDYAHRLHPKPLRPYEFLADDFDMLHATAAQRAEAFLRTIRKWEDDK